MSDATSASDSDSSQDDRPVSRVESSYDAVIQENKGLSGSEILSSSPEGKQDLKASDPSEDKKDPDLSELSVKKDDGKGGAKRYCRDDFTFGKEIGKGAYASVVSAKENQSGHTYAIKIIDKKHLQKEKKQKYALTEKEILSLCNHPNIVKLYYTFRDEKSLYYVLELCSNGELLSHLKNLGSLELSVVAFYTAEIVNALEYLHSNGIIHRDLKPENILLDEHLHIKLTDFGTAKRIGTDTNARSNSFVGTAEYVSPELLNDKVTSKSSDLWALGCIIYQMITGRPPFRGLNEYIIFGKVSSGKFEYPKDFPDVARDLIDKLLVLDPEKRLGINGYQEVKGHPFFKGIDFETIYKQTPPAMKPYTPKLLFEEDLKSEEEAKKKKMQEEENKKWQKFLRSDEIILESGLVYKRKGRSAKKRQLILTNAPRLIYVDTKKMKQKGEIPWSPDLRPETKNNTAWFIHTPKRTYILEDIAGNAHRWVDEINKILQNTNNNDPPS